MHKLLISITAVSTLISGGCSTTIFSAHRVEVQQGNAVSEETVEQLKIGMTAQQVRFLMGTPLLDDPFHTDRWNYVYFLKPARGAVQRRRVTILFESDRVVEIVKPVVSRRDREGR